jgi:putative ABC transport system permease protein
MSGFQPIAYLALAAGSLLILANAGLALLLGLGLGRQLLIGAARMVAQLLLVGLVLKTLFELASPGWTLLAAAVMIAAGAIEIATRQERRLAGPWGWSLGAGTMGIVSIAVTIFALLLTTGSEPWTAPRYALPLLGMILGNAMSGVSLAMSGLTAGIGRERAAIEAQLALGATRTEALKPLMRRSFRTALIPLVNQMSTAGLITLPGLMTGQILAGVPPVEAVKYQILIMFLLSGATAFAVVATLVLVGHRVTDQRHRLRLDRLKEG